MGIAATGAISTVVARQIDGRRIFRGGARYFSSNRHGLGLERIDGKASAVTWHENALHVCEGAKKREAWKGGGGGSGGGGGGGGKEKETRVGEREGKEGRTMHTRHTLA